MKHLRYLLKGIGSVLALVILFLILLWFIFGPYFIAEVHGDNWRWLYLINFFLISYFVGIQDEL